MELGLLILVTVESYVITFPTWGPIRSGFPGRQLGIKASPEMHRQGCYLETGRKHKLRRDQSEFRGDFEGARGLAAAKAESARNWTIYEDPARFDRFTGKGCCTHVRLCMCVCVCGQSVVVPRLSPTLFLCRSVFSPLVPAFPPHPSGRLEV